MDVEPQHVTSFTVLEEMTLVGLFIHSIKFASCVSDFQLIIFSLVMENL